MEPAINADLTHRLKAPDDLTFELLRDDVANRLFASGCTSADLIEQLRMSAANHGGFVSSVAHLVQTWFTQGLINAQQKGAVINAASRATIP